MKKSKKTLFRKKTSFWEKNFFLEKKKIRIFLQKIFFFAKNFVRMSFAKSWGVVETIKTFWSEKKEHKCENLEKKVKCLTRYKIGRRRRRSRRSFFFCSFFFHQPNSRDSARPSASLRSEKPGGTNTSKISGT